MKRILSLLVALGIVHSLGFSGDPAQDNRDALLKALNGLSDRAQEYYRKPRLLGGGEYNFATLSLSQIVGLPAPPYGSFVLTSPTATSVTLTATGVETGNDGATPVEIEVIVYADSMAVTVNN